MKYIFSMPENRRARIGGSCSSPNEIYLWCLDELKHLVSRDDVIRLWSEVIRHEHVHALLHSFGVPVDQHHKFIDKMFGPVVIGVGDG